MPDDFDKIMDQIGRLSARINEIADRETASALVNGWAAQGGLMPQKEALIRKVDELLDELLK
jgi:hypothetical protein